MISPVIAAMIEAISTAPAAGCILGSLCQGAVFLRHQIDHSFNRRVDQFQGHDKAEQDQADAPFRYGDAQNEPEGHDRTVSVSFLPLPPDLALFLLSVSVIADPPSDSLLLTIFSQEHFSILAQSAQADYSICIGGSFKGLIQSFQPQFSRRSCLQFLSIGFIHRFCPLVLSTGFIRSFYLQFLSV